LALFALLLPALFALCALGLDAGNLYVERREMQAAGDLAALAGSRLLPDAASAIAKAQQIASANGYSSTVTVTTPYGGDVMRIEVRITHPVQTLFLPILGVSQMDMSARSVARRFTAPPTTPPYVLFVGNSSCTGNGLQWLGTSGISTGLVHSNSVIKVTGNGSQWTGGTTYTCTNGFSDNRGGNVFDPPPTQMAAKSWPVTHTWDDYCSSPTYYNAAGTWDLGGNGPWWRGGTKATRTLLPGVYCADGAGAAITLNVQGTVADGVTLVSRGTIRINDGNFLITPSVLDTALAAFGSGGQAIKVQAKTGTSGMMYAPNGEADFTAVSGGIYSGGLVADTVKVSGTGFTLIGQVPSDPGTETLQLLE
jgi:hypothetical protein